MLFRQTNVIFYRHLQLYSTRAFASFLTKRHNYKPPEFLAPILKIDRSPSTTLLRASKRALIVSGKGYVSTLGKGARKEIQASEPETHELLASKTYDKRQSVDHHRRKSVVFKGSLVPRM